MVIDVHAHYIPAGLLQSKFHRLLRVDEGEDGPLIRLGPDTTTAISPGMLDLSVQAGEMDRCGIGQRFLSPSPFHFCYEDSEVVEYARAFNDSMVRESRDHGDRYRLLANLPFPHVDAAVAELERVMALPGFVGAEIATNLNGLPLGDPSLLPFWERAQELGAFVLLHPHYCFQDPRLQDRYLQNLVGNPLETTLAAFQLISEEVLRRFPRLTVCLSHGGGYMALAMARMDHGHRVRPELADLDRPPSHYARRMFVDTVVHDSQSLDFVIRRWGTSQVLLGSDYPFDMGMSDPVGAVDALDLPDKERRAILGETAAALASNAK